MNFATVLCVIAIAIAAVRITGIVHERQACDYDADQLECHSIDGGYVCKGDE